MTEFGPLSEIIVSVILYEALPVESALMLPRSPTWRLRSSGLPCGMPVGIEVSAGALAVGHRAVAEFMDVEAVLARLQAGEFANDFDAVFFLGEGDFAFHFVFAETFDHGDGHRDLRHFAMSACGGCWRFGRRGLRSAV